jgi:predicted ArsR family transcriptional regulator
MRTKERVRRYVAAHPTASVREIQKALGISSPSVVHFHLKGQTKEDKVQLLREALTACATQLAHCLGPNTEAGRIAKRALDSTK